MELVKVKILAKRLLARTEDGKTMDRPKGAIAFLDEEACRHHVAMGMVERVKDDEPKPKKSKSKAKSKAVADPEPEPEPEEGPGDEPSDPPDL